MMIKSVVVSMFPFPCLPSRSLLALEEVAEVIRLNLASNSGAAMWRTPHRADGAMLLLVTVTVIFLSLGCLVHRYILDYILASKEI
jgi:hypothetical protein